MVAKKVYREYFDIDPKYYAAVTKDLIDQGKVSWKNFFPHETFVKLLEKTHNVLSGKEPKSIWVEGAYGTGKSHAVLTVKSLLEASDDEVIAYCDDYGLSKDLCQKLITDKNSGNLIVAHRIGSGAIRSDDELILAIQDSIMCALKENDIKNYGEASLKEAALNWLSDDLNKSYFNQIIHDDKYAWEFGHEDIDIFIEQLQKGNDIQSLMSKFLKVAKDRGIRGISLDAQGMANWIKDVITKNKITVLFIWDEFTEFFQNNQNSLTGFQTLTEISQSHPFYFMIVSHESRSLFIDNATAKKILDRFVTPIKIELPENMAFRLIAQAMKKNQDPVLLSEWETYDNDLNEDLVNVRAVIANSFPVISTNGHNKFISDKELRAVFPIHPYAALLLKHLSVAFSSNQRSMFDFIISNDMMDAKGFKWYISHFGPLDELNILTIDMLWDFFYGKGQNGLNDDVRIILDSYNLLQKDKFSPEELRVLKTILLLQAISQKISWVGLLHPNERNVDLAFSGTHWSKGKGRSLAEKLCRDGVIFKKPIGGGEMVYTVANTTGDFATIEKKKKEVEDNISTDDIFSKTDFTDIFNLPAAINRRYEIKVVSGDSFSKLLAQSEQSVKANRYKVLVSFAINDLEANKLKELNVNAATKCHENIILIECLTILGKDLYDQYIEYLAYSNYYRKNDNDSAENYGKLALGCLDEWKKNIEHGAFVLYSSDKKSGKRLSSVESVKEELTDIEKARYCYGLSQYHVGDAMFNMAALQQGAECGINQILQSRFDTKNETMRLDTALKDAWHVDGYWKDVSKKALPIVNIKCKVEEMIKQGFSTSSGRISIMAIIDELEDPPYGFIPSNIAAFVLGFVLKEYASPDYFWSNGSNSENMSVGKMKSMIANALKQKNAPARNYKDEYIVEMSSEQKTFLDCTSKVFNIVSTQCGSIEMARDQIRSRMREYSFPIWCIKNILANKIEDASKINEIAMIIDCYCGIANTANSTHNSESDLANEIGRKVNADKSLIEVLVNLINEDNTREGMLEYIREYKDGILEELADQIDDNGEFLNQVKRKFNADAANWVWNTITANEKIDDVILEYYIIVESNKLNNASSTLNDAVNEWNKKSSNIKIPFDVLKKHCGTLTAFLEQLYLLKKEGRIQDQNKVKFYNLLLTEGNAFKEFYAKQVEYFKEVAAVFLDDLDNQDVEKLYLDLSGGQFLKTGTEYFNHVDYQKKAFLQNQARKKLSDLWKEKTGTKNPNDWSDTYKTPIYCMFCDDERVTVKEWFSVFDNKAAKDTEVNSVIGSLENVEFFARMADASERDSCFRERVIGRYSIILSDVNEVRDYLSNQASLMPHDWFESTTIRNKLEDFCKKKYLLNGKEIAMNIIRDMSGDEAKKYLFDLIDNNLNVGLEIIKNKK